MNAQNLFGNPLHWADSFPGYSREDLVLLDEFHDPTVMPLAGFVMDFIGGRTRTDLLWNEARGRDGTVMGLPIPADLFETIEWIGLLKSIRDARARQRGNFVAMELGAGWGPWLVHAANAARRVGIIDFHFCGVEADPGRFEMMKQHFRDNGLEPAEHDLVLGAAGVVPGTAQWPIIADPQNSGGARPVRNNVASDLEYMQGLSGPTRAVEITSFADLLHRSDRWDFVHIDIQGWEFEICEAFPKEVRQRVAWLVIGTHSRKIEGDLLQMLLDQGWICENEKPTRFAFNSSRQNLETMTTVDGAQVWRNPTLG
jgi:FkbM family methyltransferase